MLSVSENQNVKINSLFVKILLHIILSFVAPVARGERKTTKQTGLPPFSYLSVSESSHFLYAFSLCYIANNIIFLIRMVVILVFQLEI